MGEHHRDLNSKRGRVMGMERLAGAYQSTGAPAERPKIHRSQIPDTMPRQLPREYSHYEK